MIGVLIPIFGCHMIMNIHLDNLLCQSVAHHSSSMIHLHSIRFLKEKVKKKLILHPCATQPQNEGHYSVVYLKTQKLQLINVKSI